MIIHTLWNNKHLGFIFLLLLILSSCYPEYREHFFAERSQSAIISAEYHQYRDDDSLWILPDKKIKEELITSLDTAKHRVWIEIYLWTDTDILDAVVEAHTRGVDVRVILDGNVYGLPRANAKIYDTLTDVGIPVVYSDSYRFTFTHAKFLLIDDRFYISSGNFTRSFFESNRDFIYSSTDRDILSFLGEVFLADFDYRSIDISTIPHAIILSPTDSSPKLSLLLSGAIENIIIYTQTLSDPDMIQLLQSKQKEGVDVKICTADNKSNIDSSQDKELRWVFLKKPYLHGKILIIDGKRFFLGSQNLTTNSLENNREVGILIENSPDFISRLKGYFEKDCHFD